jgi:hypothetical protein
MNSRYESGYGAQLPATPECHADVVTVTNCRPLDLVHLAEFNLTPR